MINTIRLVLEILFYHPWKILHEVMILLTATLFAKVKENNLIPKMENEKITPSKVTFVSSIELTSGLISISPLLWLVAFYYLGENLDIILIYPLENYLYLTIHTSIFSEAPVWKLFLLFHLFAAGIPKAKELKQFFLGIISPAGFMLVVASSILVKLYFKYGGF